MSQPPLRPARSLRFGTWPYRPRWLVAPVLEEAAGRDLAEMPAEEATWVVEGLAMVQGVRAPLLAAPVLALTAVLEQLGAPGAGEGLVSVLTVGAVLTLPGYMAVMGILHLVLRRSGTSTEPMAAAHPRLLRIAGVAPFLAMFLALLTGAALH